jgi:hypothetical protein
LDRKEGAAWFCFKQWRSWFTLWIAFYELLTSSCLLDNARLHYDPATNVYSNVAGVETRPRDFGGLSGVDYVDHTDDFFGFTIVCKRSFFIDFVRVLVLFFVVQQTQNSSIAIAHQDAEMINKFRAVGYVDGTTLFGAPFDFRLPLHAIIEGTFGLDLFKLIDEACTLVVCLFWKL